MRILFLCTHNSARSQMAEGLLKHFYGEKYEVFSAGSNPTQVHPFTTKIMVAPCGLYCGVCSGYLVNMECHGCFCECGDCAASYHHKECSIYQCCVEQRGYEGCHECEELPCSKLIRFCFDPVWTSHSPVIENLRRRKAVGTEEWLEEQRKIFSDEKTLKRWLWLHKECEKRWKSSQEK